MLPAFFLDSATQGLIDSLRQDAGDGLALDQLARLVEVVVDDGVRIEADAVVDGRPQLARMDRVLQRRRGRLVRLAPDEAALDAGAGDDRGIAVGPVVAAIVAVLVAGSA